VDDESLSRLVAVTGPAGSSNGALAAAVASVRNAAAGSYAVILVEGISDQFAIEALAARRGRNLGQERAFVVPMGAFLRHMRRPPAGGGGASGAANVRLLVKGSRVNRLERVVAALVGNANDNPDGH